MRNNRGPILLSLFIIVLLQITNFLFVESGAAEINTGFVFGLVEVGYFFLIPIAISILVLLLMLKADQAGKLLLSLVLAGSVSNLLDRVIWGGVVDYIELGPLPTFNSADVLIILCFLLYLVHRFLGEMKTSSQNRTV